MQEKQMKGTPSQLKTLKELLEAIDPTQQKCILMFTQTRTRMFLAALFILAKARTYPRGPMPAEWVNKWRSLPTMEQRGDERCPAMSKHMGHSQMYC